MKIAFLSVWLLMVSFALADTTATADFYVSVAGSDDWSGTLAQPNVQRSDGPFATLRHARDAVRELKKGKATDILVLIREGTYLFTETVVFRLEDSGAGDATITYAAYPGEQPVFSSGREITGWQKAGKASSAADEVRRKGLRGGCLWTILHPL